MQYRERGRLHREAGEEGKREEGQKRREARDEATPSGWSGDSPDGDVEELGIEPSSIWESGRKRLIGRAWKLRRSGGLVGIDGWMGR